ncbi:MAG: hypothetical protein J6K21_00780 [Bacilli bacterium]|nr:hypothetical protein [Bacilli bacterium]
MNYNDILIKYIDEYPYDEPIFIEDIKDFFKNYIKNNFDDVFKNIYVYINRLVKDNKLIQFIKGIYYKPLTGAFGNKLLNINKVIDKKYIHDGTRQKGYLTGAYLFNKIGLTTQIPKEILIVTNECPNANDYNNKNLGVIIRRPKIEINDDNYKYLQLFDVLINKDNIKIEVDNEKEIIYKFIKDNGLEFEKIFEYANKINNSKPIKRLYELGGENIE